MDESNIIYQDQIRRHTDSIRRWYQFFAIVSIVSASLYLVAAVLLFVFGGTINKFSPQPVPIQLYGIVYLLGVAIMVPAIIYLMKAAKAGKMSVALNNPADMVAFMRWSKHFWKYCGILTIVMLGILLLTIAFVVVYLVSAV